MAAEGLFLATRNSELMGSGSQTEEEKTPDVDRKCKRYFLGILLWSLAEGPKARIEKRKT